VITENRKAKNVKTAKDWAREIRETLGNGLRYDPCLTTGKTLLEAMVEQIQDDARSDEKPEAVTAQQNAQAHL
jgi:hypothetical protein